MPSKFFSIILFLIITISFLPYLVSAQTIVQNDKNIQNAEELIEKTKNEKMPPDETTLSERTISISPVTFELTANPGETITNKLKIRNTGTEPLALTMEAENFTTVGEGGEVVVKEPEDASYSLAQWIVTNPKNFLISPGEEKIVDFSIVVPVDAEPGGHYATIMASAAGTTPGTTGLAFTQKTGSLVLLTVTGEIKEGLLIREFKVPRFSEYGPIPFKIRFENTGTVHVKPIGFISISNIFDKKIIDLPFPYHNIYPGKIRTIETNWDKKWLFGKYTATLVGNYGLNNTPFTALTSFWVIPWKIICGILLGLAIIFFLLWKIRRRIFASLRVLIKGE